MAGMWQRGSTERDARWLAAEIDRLGFAAIENYVSDEELADIRALAQAKVQAAGGEYVALEGPGAVDGTLLGTLGRAPEFSGLCRRVVELGTRARAPDANPVQVLRCLQGSTGQSNSNRFHYDSYVLTVIIAIAAPDTGRRGDLVLFGRKRAIRRLYFMNMVDKFLVDNAVSQWIFRAAARRNRLGAVRIGIRPGTAYFIWGYQTLHANEPCDQDKMRATAVFHFGDPHQHSGARRLIRTARTRLGRLRAAS
jgi:hypothetical protein